jgi:hypothetical protein
MLYRSIIIKGSAWSQASRDADFVAEDPPGPRSKATLLEHVEILEIQNHGCWKAKTDPVHLPNLKVVIINVKEDDQLLCTGECFRRDCRCCRPHGCNLLHGLHGYSLHIFGYASIPHDIASSSRLAVQVQRWAERASLVTVKHDFNSSWRLGIQDAGASSRLRLLWPDQRLMFTIPMTMLWHKLSLYLDYPLDTVIEAARLHFKEIEIYLLPVPSKCSPARNFRPNHFCTTHEIPRSLQRILEDRIAADIETANDQSYPKVTVKTYSDWKQQEDWSHVKQYDNPEWEKAAFVFEDPGFDD